MASQQARLTHLACILLISIIFLLGLALRTVNIGDVPFQGGDGVSTAWATVWYYPRGLNSFGLGDSSLEPNPIGIINLIHGPLQVVVAYLWVTLVSSFLNIPIVEFVWHLPFAVLGSVTILASYLLGSKLQSNRAGILSALFVAVIPLHVAFSRTSGESHYILASLLQIISILLWWQYLTTKLKWMAFLTGLTVAADMLTDFMFPGLLLTLFFSSLIYHFGRLHRPRSALVKAFFDMSQWQFILPLAVPFAVHGYAILQIMLYGKPVGMLGRFISSSQNEYTEVGGIFIGPAIENLAYTTNILVVLIGFTTVLLVTVKLKYMAKASVPLFWSLVYIIPFVFFVSRGRLVGHFIPVSVAFCILIAMTIDKLWDSKFVFAFSGIAAVTVFLSLLLTTLSMVFGISTWTIFHRPIEHGGIGYDRGTKAAALWVRQNTPTRSIIFTDPFAKQSLSLGMYYYHRPVISQELSQGVSLETVLQLLSKNLSRVDIIIIGAEHLDLLQNEVKELYATSAIILVNEKPSLYILTRRDKMVPEPEVINAEMINRKYDELYAELEDIIALPLREIQEAKSQIE